MSDDTDCDDREEDANPGEAEVCDGIDNDCDGDTDDADSSVDTSAGSTYYEDDDGDGYGDADDARDACAQPKGYVSDDTDCDDGDAAVSPGEVEACNDVDDDCDGDIDEGVTTTFYLDYDGDGYGDVSPHHRGLLGALGLCQRHLGLRRHRRRHQPGRRRGVQRRRRRLRRHR